MLPDITIISTVIWYPENYFLFKSKLYFIDLVFTHNIFFFFENIYFNSISAGLYMYYLVFYVCLYERECVHASVCVPCMLLCVYLWENVCTRICISSLFLDLQVAGNISQHHLLRLNSPKEKHTNKNFNTFASQKENSPSVSGDQYRKLFCRMLLKYSVLRRAWIPADYASLVNTIG